MFKDLLDNLKFFFLKLRLKRALNADEKFLRLARERFVARVSPGYVPARPASVGVIRVRYAAVALVLFVCATGGLAAFADYSDVPVTNPLYDLKRASENVRVVLTPASEKPAVHVQLAQRRLKEIDEVVAVVAKASPSPTVSPSASPTAVALQPFAVSKIKEKNDGEKLESAPVVDLASSSLSTTASATASSSATPLPIIQKLDDDLKTELNNAISATASASQSVPNQQVQDNANTACQIAAQAFVRHLIQPDQSQTIQIRCFSRHHIRGQD